MTCLHCAVLEQGWVVGATCSPLVTDAAGVLCEPERAGSGETQPVFATRSPPDAVHTCQWLCVAAGLDPLLPLIGLVVACRLPRLGAAREHSRPRTDDQGDQSTSTRVCGVAGAGAGSGCCLTPHPSMCLVPDAGKQRQSAWRVALPPRTPQCPDGAPTTGRQATREWVGGRRARSCVCPSTSW